MPVLLSSAVTAAVALIGGNSTKPGSSSSYYALIKAVLSNRNRLSLPGMALRGGKSKKKKAKKKSAACSCSGSLAQLPVLALVPTCSQVWTSAALIEAYDFSMTIYRKRRRTIVS